MKEMKELVWNSLLTAQMNACYWNRLARRYHARETAVKIFLAITSSGTVAGWAFWADHSVVWKALSGLSAILAVTLPVVDYSGQVKTMTELASKCAQLRASYDLLWAQIEQMPTESLREAVRSLALLGAEFSEKEAVLPNDEELLQRCYEEVCRSRNLETA